MNRLTVVALIVIAALVSGVVYWASSQYPLLKQSQQKMLGATGQGSHPGRTGQSSNGPTPPVTRTTVDQLAAFSALDYPQLMTRVATESLAGKEFVAAYVAESCSRYFEARATGRLVSASTTVTVGSRETEAQRLARERLRTRSETTRCAEWRTALSPAEIRRLYEAAAARGDTRARVWLLNADLRSTAEAPKTVRLGADTAVPDVVQPLTLTPAALATLTDALSSRDPTAIRMAGELLFATYRDGELRYGYTPGVMVDGVTSAAVWNLLACEYGADCGQQSTFLSERCAFEGRCDVDTIRDYLMKYDLDPSQAGEILAIVARFRAGIETGDWNFLTFVPVAAAERRHWNFLPRQLAPVAPIH